MRGITGSRPQQRELLAERSPSSLHHSPHLLQMKNSGVKKKVAVKDALERRALQTASVDGCPTTICSTEGQNCIVDDSGITRVGSCVATTLASPSSGINEHPTTTTPKTTITAAPVLPGVIINRRRALQEQLCFVCEVSDAVTVTSDDECYDLPDWADNEGDHCSAYVACSSGYHTSLSSSLFDHYSNNGYSALEACCACGGGSTNEFEHDGITNNQNDMSSSAVLFAVIFGVLVFVGLTCAAVGVAVRSYQLRQQRRRAEGADESGQDAEGKDNSGMPEALIQMLPSSAYESPESSQFAQTSCIVCICEFSHGTMLTTLPCGHKFHKECIYQWFKHGKTCPVCKLDVEGSMLQTLFAVQETIDVESRTSDNEDANATVSHVRAQGAQPRQEFSEQESRRVESCETSEAETAAATNPDEASRTVAETNPQEACGPAAGTNPDEAAGTVAAALQINCCCEEIDSQDSSKQSPAADCCGSNASTGTLEAGAASSASSSTEMSMVESTRP